MLIQSQKPMIQGNKIANSDKFAPQFKALDGWIVYFLSLVIHTSWFLLSLLGLFKCYVVLFFTVVHRDSSSFAQCLPTTSYIQFLYFFKTQYAIFGSIVVSQKFHYRSCRLFLWLLCNNFSFKSHCNCLLGTTIIPKFDI